MKRSFGSNSSGNSGSNKKSKKKNPSNQKTLGVAWGAASLPSSRSSFRSSPFSDFGSYMEVKNRKLQNQYETEASAASSGASGSEKLIFQGVSIFVDGFTVPSHQVEELMAAIDEMSRLRNHIRMVKNPKQLKSAMDEFSSRVKNRIRMIFAP